MGNDMTKRLMWSGLLAGVGALTTIVANRVAAGDLGEGLRRGPARRLMVDAPNQGATETPRPRAGRVGHTALGVPAQRGDRGGALADHPEVLVGGAFVGGFALALIVRRISR